VQLIDAAQLDDRAVACMWAGSGYVAAVLASMGLTVHAVESALPLRQMAMDALSAIGLAERVVWYDDVESVPASTVQAAIVCAAMNRFPRQLLSRLPQDGRLVVPIQRGRQAVISVITRQGHGHRRHDRPAVQMLSLDGAPMRR
jgi:protein-L-isoaspartate O-methyltransferase